jgi:hypothetical protein
VPIEGELDAFAAQVACSPHPSYLVYYLDGSSNVVDLDEMRAVVRTERVATVPGRGTILRLAADSDAPCPDGTDPTPTSIR